MTTTGSGERGEERGWRALESTRRRGEGVKQMAIRGTVGVGMLAKGGVKARERGVGTREGVEGARRRGERR